MKTMVLHHADLDGFGSAYVLTRKNPGSLCHEVQYRDSFPEDLLNDVERCYVVDFSFPADVMAGVSGRHPNVEFVVIDHHDTAPDIVAPNVRTYIMRGGGLPAPQKKAGVDLVLEVVGSEHLTQDEVRILRLIGRRDVWDFSDPDVKPLNAALFPKARTFGDFCRVVSGTTAADLIRCGYDLLEYQEVIIATALKTAGVVEIAGRRCLAVNTPVLPSETGNRLAQASLERGLDPIGVVYNYDLNKGIWSVSLRSLGDVDVAAIAKQFGGGGHKNAAGIKSKTLPFKEGE